MFHYSRRTIRIPQGHSRFEPIVGMLVTLSMTFAGFQAAKAAIARISEGAISIDPGLPTLILLVSAAVKLDDVFLYSQPGAHFEQPDLTIRIKG